MAISAYVPKCQFFRLSGEALFSVNYLWLTQCLILKFPWTPQSNTSISLQVLFSSPLTVLRVWLSMTSQVFSLCFTFSFWFSSWTSPCTSLTSYMASGFIHSPVPLYFFGPQTWKTSQMWTNLIIMFLWICRQVSWPQLEKTTLRLVDSIDWMDFTYASLTKFC